MPGRCAVIQEQALAADAFNVFHAVATGPAVVPVAAVVVQITVEAHRQDRRLILLIVHNGFVFGRDLRGRQRLAPHLDFVHVALVKSALAFGIAAKLEKAVVKSSLQSAGGFRADRLSIQIQHGVALSADAEHHLVPIRVVQ